MDNQPERTMNTETPTPETDSAYIQCPNEGAWDFRIRQEKTMAKLERERDEWKAKYIQQNKDLGHELRDPNGTIWSECKRLQTELDAVTKQRDGLRSGIDYASDQLHTVTEQRDRLAEALKAADECLERASFSKNGYTRRVIDEALQSLTPNEL